MHFIMQDIHWMEGLHHKLIENCGDQVCGDFTHAPPAGHGPRAVDCLAMKPADRRKFILQKFLN